MSNFLQFCPNDIFNGGQDRGVYQVKDASIRLTAATNNQQIVAAVSGAKIVVVSGSLCSANTAGAVDFKSASGGTISKRYLVPVSTAATPNTYVEAVPWGAFRTNSGEGLFADNLGADIIIVSLAYIEMKV